MSAKYKYLHKEAIGGYHERSRSASGESKWGLTFSVCGVARLGPYVVCPTASSGFFYVISTYIHSTPMARPGSGTSVDLSPPESPLISLFRTYTYTPMPV